MKLSPQEIAARRFHPRLTDPNWPLLRARRVIFEDWAAQVRPKKLTILDVGGRYQPYRPLFEGRIDRYIAVDVLKTDLVSVLASGEALPFPSGTFDLVITTQVFEYFADPQTAARQVHAVLKPGGVLLASAVACAPRFADEEHWRFTPSGLRSLLAPFQTVEIVPELYSVSSLVRTINLAMNNFVRYESVRKLYGHTVCPLLNLLAVGAENLHLTRNDQFTANYSVRATKAG